MSKQRRQPGYLHHKARNQAKVIIDGRVHYLGPYDSPESHERYDELIVEWQRNQSVDRYTLTLAELALKYNDHCKSFYRKNGRPTSEVACVRIALRFAVRHCGAIRARDFGPLKFREVRETMIDQGLARTSINKHCNQCHREYERARRTSKSRTDFKKFTTDLKNARSVARVHYIIERMLPFYGGAEGFVDSWISEIKRCREGRGGSKRLLDAHLAMIKLIATADRARHGG